EEDREAGVPGRVLAAAHGPGTVRGLGREEVLRALDVPVVVADLLRPREDARALDAVEVVQRPGVAAAGVLRGRPVGVQPGQAVLHVLVLLPVLMVHVVVDRERADGAGGHRAVGLPLVGALVGPSRGLAGSLAARDDRALPGLVLAFRRVHGLDQPAVGELSRLLGDDDARVVAGAEPERRILRVRVVARGAAV